MSEAEKEPIERIERETRELSKSDSDPTQLEWTEEEETRIRRKIDWHTVPLVTLLYLLCFLDRINVGNARIQGLAHDLGIEKGVRFNWALSIFYIVYLLVEVPSNIVLKYVGPRYYLPLLVCGFGIVTLGIAFVNTWEGLMVARTFLGICEGGAFPGLAFFLSCFYKRKELLFRVGIYVSAASLAGAFGGLLAAGLSQIPEWGVAGAKIHTWKNIFFFEGLITMIVGALAPIWMPTTPGQAHFLTERERLIAAERLAREHRSDPQEKVNLKHIKQAIFCIHNYTCALGFFCVNITVQGLSVFMPTILNDLNWKNTQAQLMTVPPYVAACLGAVAVAYASDKTHRRGIYLACFAVVAMTGFAILRWAEDRNVRYMAVWFVTIGAFPGGPGFLAWAMNNSAGPAVRAVSSAYVVTLGTLGGIVATWTYVPSDAPKYHTGHTINFVGELAVIVLAVFGIFYCMYENKARAAGKRDHRLEGLSPEEQEDLGSRHPDFRYIL